jgi:multidrug resistance efflux pump
MRRRFRLINIVAVLCVAILVIGAAVLLLGTMDETVEAVGLVKPARYEKVRAQADGIIRELRVDEGDHVRQGDTLVKLESDELTLAIEKAQSRLDQTRSDLAQLEEEHQNLVLSESFETQSAFANLYQAQRRMEIAKRKYDRSESLFERGLISAEERDDRQLEYELAQSYHASLRDRADLLEKRFSLEIAEQREQVELARTEYHHLVSRQKQLFVVAPITGEVLSSEIDELVGRRVMVGEVILDIGDCSQMTFVAEIHEMDIPRVQAGMAARIFINAFPHRRYGVFGGEVFRVSPRPEVTNRGIVFETEVHIDDPWVELDSSEVPLKPGLSGETEIVLRQNVRLIELLLDIDI